MYINIMYMYRYIYISTYLFYSLQNNKHHFNHPWLLLLCPGSWLKVLKKILRGTNFSRKKTVYQVTLVRKVVTLLLRNFFWRICFQEKSMIFLESSRIFLGFFELSGFWRWVIYEIPWGEMIHMMQCVAWIMSRIRVMIPGNQQRFPGL